MKPILMTAFHYIRYYKSQTAAILLSIIFSVALLSGVGSLVYSGQRSQLETNRIVYGDWNYYFPADDETILDVKAHPSDRGYQITKTGRIIRKDTLAEPYVIYMEYVDAGYLSMMGYKFREGKYPQNSSEIALDEYTVSNVLPGGGAGDKITLGKKEYVISGILKKASVQEASAMKAFVSRDWTGESEERSYLYVQFRDDKKMYYQIKALAKSRKIEEDKLYTNWNVNAFLGGSSIKALPGIIKSGLSLPDGKYTYIWMNLNDSFQLTLNGIRLCLLLFAGFTIYSIFNISIWKRISQYGIMQVLGIGEKSLFAMLVLELWSLFLIGFPFGIFLGNEGARLIFARFSFIFTGTQEGSTDFFLDGNTVKIGLVFLLIFLGLVSVKIIYRLRKMTLIQMIGKTDRKDRRSRKIYSRKTAQMSRVLTNKFMLEKKGTFAGIVLSLALGGLVFLGTNYVIVNTEKNNELTMKADDGLGSDMELYMEADQLSQVIPEQQAGEIRKLPYFNEVSGVSYLLGELPFLNGEWTWEEYYPETAVKKDPSRKKEIDPLMMKRYNGTITDEGNGNYKIKTNVYGYDTPMIQSLSDYLLEGEIDLGQMREKNQVILKTVMDAQGNYDGLKVKAGDTITLKVPKSQDVPEEVLRFQSPDREYIEKEFTVGAVVSRSLGKNQFFIGDEYDSNFAIIMTNEQMKDYYGVSGYTSLSLQLKDGADHKEAYDHVKAITGGISRCILKDYTAEIERQKIFLQQKMFFFYGIAALLLIISLFHIINSMNYLVLSRRHEFGILRAMGITDAGFLKMMIGEGVRYGIYTGIVTMAGFVVIKRILLYFLQHVYLYVYINGSVSWKTFAFVLSMNLIVGVLAVCLPVRQLLKETIVEEIAAE